MRHSNPARQRRWLPYIGLCLTLTTTVALGDNCNRDSDSAAAAASRFSNPGDGTLIDASTGLAWKRCSEGQTWDGATCTGSASKHDWREALDLAEGATDAGHDDWRVPSLDELASLIDKACAHPALDLSTFPDTPAGVFWSSTRDATNPAYAWYVHFHDGHAAKGHQSRGAFVRLVRGGD
ncbi:MAG: DUF1566 domain-containing protein [Chromatiaceae bacterium]|jgi:hypothetical protein|nr:DUF1566 domain-containing protein [Chromatiaceae bacterium]